MELEHLIQTFTILTTLHSFLLATYTTLHSFLHWHSFVLAILHYTHPPTFLPSCKPTLPSLPCIPSYRAIPSFLQSYTTLTTLHSFLQSHTFLLANLNYDHYPISFPSCKPTQTLPSLPYIFS